ncbi:MAG: hypothetical protein H5T86_09785 [Armatimonadetes bacterium]|nr:hypothetical protein [Armatimonadota bacterium]
MGDSQANSAYTVPTNPFALAGEWFKGNLHTHTTVSDGELSPQATVELYAREGYDFLAISDHGTIVDPDDVDPLGMVLLPAVELTAGPASLGQSYHLLAVGVREKPELNGASVQDQFDAVRRVSELLFIAHPYWSSLTCSDLLAVQGYDGIEVYNTTCQRGIGRGQSGPHFDGLLAVRGSALGIAVDDAHFHYWDAMGGWIMVKAERPTAPALLSAIKSGAFYASSGPEIRRVVIGDDAVHVECSPAVTVALVVAAPGLGWTTDRLGWRRDRRLVTEATLPLEASRGHPFRIEVIDEAGNRAWTNPMTH